MRVSCEGVSVTIDDSPIVSDIDISIESGQCVALIGPNGSGKSTFLRCIYRALRPVAGEIRLDDRELWSLPATAAARTTAAVLQESTSEFDFSVREVVQMGRTPHKGLLARDNAEDERIVAESLARVSMAEFASRSYFTLSGGEKQRVLVARALAQQTQFIVLDEPTNHLDIRYQHEVLDLVRSLGVTILTALHDLNLAAEYGDYIYVLREGKILAAGEPEAVLTPELVYDAYGVRALPYTHPVTGRYQLALYKADAQGRDDGASAASTSGMFDGVARLP
jgi:iron complex transport system ATP-binding protein